jgi:N-acetylglucosamine-6-phosphate deacetylase
LLLSLIILNQFFLDINTIGSIQVGKQANLVIFDKEMKLSHVILNGNIVEK